MDNVWQFDIIWTSAMLWGYLSQVETFQCMKTIDTPENIRTTGWSLIE